MAHFEPTFSYDAPPEGEIRLDFGEGTPYAREFLRCTLCGHFVSSHDLDLERLYEGRYVDAAYGEAGLRRSYDRIMALSPFASDSVGRTQCIAAFAAAHFSGSNARPGPLTLLDVGSGLCVFPARMRDLGWRCTALDPDARAARHAREYVGIDAVCGDFMEVEADQLDCFDLITFNKILEHVADPVAMLSGARRFLRRGGIVYVELPDGEAAATAGAGREEFFIDHHHAFSLASLALLAKRAEFAPLSVERLREPSSKYTLRAFLVPNPQAPTGASDGV